MLTLKFLYGACLGFQLKGGTQGTEFCLDSSADRQFCTLALFLNAGKMGANGNGGTHCANWAWLSEKVMRGEETRPMFRHSAKGRQLKTDSNSSARSAAALKFIFWLRLQNTVIG